MMETVYAPNAVTLILSGKVDARANRAHDLIDIALHCVLASVFLIYLQLTKLLILLYYSGKDSAT